MEAGKFVKIIGGKHKKQYEDYVGKIISATSKFCIVEMGGTIEKVRVANKFLELLPHQGVEMEIDEKVNKETGEANPNFVYDEAEDVEWGKDENEEEVYDEINLKEQVEKLQNELLKTRELLSECISNDKLTKVENQKLKDLLQFYL